MAILKGGPAGQITGKLGNVVVRKVNGKQVVSIRPKTYKKTKSKMAKSVRSRFSVAVEFSRHINSIPQLKKVWAAANKKCFSAFNRIEKDNIPFVGELAPSLKNTITPSGFSLTNPCGFPFKEITFDGSELTGNPDPHFEYAQYQDNKNYSLVFAFSFFDPKGKVERYFVLDSIVYSNPFTSADHSDEPYLLPVSLPIQEKAGRYNRVIMYAAAVVTGKGPKQCAATLTRSREFNLP